MNINTRISYLTFILIGIIFLLVGNALNELEIIREVNSNSVSSGNNLDFWYEFLQPYIGSEDNGLPTPWEDQ